MAMTFGIHIGHMGGPMEEMRRLWRFADSTGFDWFSLSDHFQESPPQGGDLDCFESVSTMAAAAVETRRVRLGSLVFCSNYRNPGLLAKAVCTLDHLSGGRMECGIGAGWHKAEHEAYGYIFPSVRTREDRLEEYAQALRLLFDPSRRRVDFAGKHFRLVNAPCNPKPLQPKLPLWIGGGGEKRTLRAAARYADGWNVPYFGPDIWGSKNRILDQWCEREGRDPSAIMRTANIGFYMGADETGAARGRALHKTHFHGDPRTGQLLGTLAEVVDLVGAYRDAGCHRLTISLREGPYDWEALQAYAEEVLPRFGSARPAMQPQPATPPLEER
jgi:alkanesulfonate monooxygenase SsuD/methylene tetrahydromethanopterin reductase-like flavin-dependent oxidoreductase (luciferase family)